jgi:hypothetical protein
VCEVLRTDSRSGDARPARAAPSINRSCSRPCSPTAAIATKAARTPVNAASTTWSSSHAHHHLEVTAAGVEQGLSFGCVSHEDAHGDTVGQ